VIDQTGCGVGQGVMHEELKSLLEKLPEELLQELLQELHREPDHVIHLVQTLRHQKGMVEDAKVGKLEGLINWSLLYQFTRSKQNNSNEN